VGVNGMGKILDEVANWRASNRNYKFGGDGGVSGDEIVLV